MSGFVVIPNSLRDAILEKITKALNGRAITDNDRDCLYYELLEYFDKNGKIPNFEIEPKTDDGEYDPTPYCIACGAKQEKHCDCGPTAENN